MSTESTALRLWIVLARASASVSRHSEADIIGEGLTPAAFGILEVLFHKGPLLLGEIQRKVLVTSGGTTYLVDRLVEKGLVKRTDCPTDRRARYVMLTAKGAALMRAMFPKHARAIVRAVSGLSEAEQVTAARLLKKLGTAAAGLPVPAPGKRTGKSGPAVQARKRRGTGNE